MTIIYHPQMPEDCGNYLFRLKTGELLYAYLCSFSYPYDEHVRYADLENEHFYYLHQKEITGYYAFN